MHAPARRRSRAPALHDLRHAPPPRGLGAARVPARPLAMPGRHARAEARHSNALGRARGGLAVGPSARRVRWPAPGMPGVAVGASAFVLVGLRHRRLTDRPPDDQQQRHDRDLQHHGEPKDAPEPAHRKESYPVRAESCVPHRGFGGRSLPSTAPEANSAVQAPPESLLACTRRERVLSAAHRDRSPQAIRTSTRSGSNARWPAMPVASRRGNSYDQAASATPPTFQ
jgi:hypothetical protein